jgi:hypothetical protein
MSCVVARHPQVLPPGSGRAELAAEPEDDEGEVAVLVGVESGVRVKAMPSQRTPLGVDLDRSALVDDRPRIRDALPRSDAAAAP